MDQSSQKINKFFSGKIKSVFRFFVDVKYFVKENFLSGGKKNLRAESDRNLVYSLAPTKIPGREQLRHLFKFLNPKEKTILKLAILVFLISASYLGFVFYQKHLILVPTSGGTYIEGLVGYPQSINPLYSNSRDVDADLSRLIYSRLFNYDENGRLMPDLASAWKIEDGGKSYIISLREGVKWHSGEDLSIDDIIFTFNLIKNPDFRSSLRTSLNGVDIEKIDDHSVKFSLSEPYADFLSLLSFGIMPANTWENISPETASLSELNLKPMGSGPYKFESLIKSKGGEIKEYHLIANDDYYGAKPYIKEIIFKFFPDYVELVRALNGNEVDAASYIPDDLKKDLLAKHSLVIHNLRLPQINSIFFNKDRNKSLGDIKVRQALAFAINRDYLFGEILGASVSRADGPIIAPDFSYTPDGAAYNLDKDKAEQLLDESGFKRVDVNREMIDNPEHSPELAAIITYASSTQMDATGYWRVALKDKEYQILALKLSVPENGRMDVAESLKKDWEAVGIKTTIVPVSVASLNAEMIAGHNFEAFLYGQVVGTEPDVASFWHSSQIGGQGLNLSGYNNAEVDTLLIEARQAADNVDLRLSKYKKFQEIVSKDLPVIFLYSPSYTYVQSKKVHGFEGTAINEPCDRFAGFSHWYLKTKKHLSW
ncbi:MAG: peptide ABC transporter substrate-binding protein [Patescibacteria group bacterium]|nr:peptide ABC transporter substrate-binding protein [Patescibacteria group bacterium]